MAQSNQNNQNSNFSGRFSGRFSGVFTALITPFKNGEIDWASMKRLLRSQLDANIDGFVVNGTTAESPVLTEQERLKIFEFVRSECGRGFPLIMGTGTNSTAESINQTKKAEQLGADAVLVVVPYYNKPPQRGLFQHYQKIAESTGLPVILYNVPSRTITQLEFQTILELSKLQNIVGIKEASGDIAFGSKLIRACGADFFVTSGDDGSFLDLMSAGGAGVISVGSHIFGKKFVDWSKRVKTGDVTVQAEFATIRDLNTYLYIEANPIPLKMALCLMGLIDSPELRLPLTVLSEPYTEQLKSKMLEAGIL